LKNKVSFWLIPSEEDRIFFQEIIDTLSQEYDAPAFTPHVTIYSGEYTQDESVAELIEKATQDVQSFSLKLDKLLYTEEFTKTVFVQFHPNPLLRKISDTLGCNSKNPSEFSLNPHLSLIYKHLSEEIKKKLMSSISLPKSEVFFNEVRAISTPGKVQGRDDVERWKLICNRKLQ
jgi:2'-5' RNA ligase